MAHHCAMKRSRTLNDYIRRRGITARTLARELGISDVFLSEIRHGKKVPSLPLAVQIVTRTGVTYESLLGREEERA